MTYIITYGDQPQKSKTLYELSDVKEAIIGLIGNGYAVEEIQLYRAAEIAGVDLSFSWVSLGDSK